MRMMRVLPDVAMAAALAVSTAGPALANVSGPGCGATASDTTGHASPPSITITNTDTWHVKSDSNLTGEGHAGSDQTEGHASAGAFGVGVIPIASGTGHGQSGHGSLDVSQYKGIARVFYGVGGSDSCSGSLTVIVDDVSPLSTVIGIGSLALFIIGLIGVLAVAIRRRGPGMRVVAATLVGIIFGLIMGLGLYEFLVQNGSFDPASSAGLGFLIVGVIIGAVAAILGGRRPDTTTIVTPGPPPAPGTPVTTA